MLKPPSVNAALPEQLVPLMPPDTMLAVTVNVDAAASAARLSPRSAVL